MTRRPASRSACPVCQAPAAAAYRPFCSDRCAKVDLHRWFAGSYAIPGDAAPDASREAQGDDEG